MDSSGMGPARTSRGSCTRKTAGADVAAILVLAPGETFSPINPPPFLTNTFPAPMAWAHQPLPIGERKIELPPFAKTNSTPAAHFIPHSANAQYPCHTTNTRIRIEY